MTTESGIGATKARAQETAGTAQQHAGAVAGTTKEQAANVAQSAQAQAGAVVGEAKTQALGVLDGVRQQVSEQSSVQRDRLAGFLTSTGGELNRMAAASDAPGIVTQLVQQAGDRVSALGDELNYREPTELLDQLRMYARRKPGTFLLGALGLGLLAGRITRGATAASSKTSDAPIGTGRHAELEPLSTAPTPAYDPAYDAPAYTTSGHVSTSTTGGAYRPETGTGAVDDVSLYGENVDEDLLPHHVRSDIPSMSTQTTHGTMP